MNVPSQCSDVQLQILTATVKLFLKQPSDTQDMVQRVLQLATEGSDNPDLRDRGFVYWRLLSTNPEAAKFVVLCEKPSIGKKVYFLLYKKKKNLSEHVGTPKRPNFSILFSSNVANDTSALEPEMLDCMIAQISTLASVYHKPPEAFVTRVAPVREESHDDVVEVYGMEDNEADIPEQDKVPDVDLLDLGCDGSSGWNSETKTPAAVNKQLVCPASQGQGTELSAAWVNSVGKASLEFDVTNQSDTAIQTFAVQFNKNALGLAPGLAQLVFPTPLQPRCTGNLR